MNKEPTKKLEDFPLVTTGPVKITPLSPSGKIPMPSKESTELEFHVDAEKYLDSEWEKISLEILRKGLGLTQKDFSPEVAEKASGRGKPGKKPEIPKRVNSRKVVLRENFC